jgi:hypothetical protein
MADVYGEISEKVQALIEAQHIFFVATAPLNGDGHINLSPKGHDCFRILSPNKVAYLDLTGSGNETSAHLMENGRITFMFCAFEGPADIIRLYGQGRAVLPDTPEWAALIPQFEPMIGMRQLIVADIDRVQTSCGYAVPFFDYREDRQSLVKWADNKGDDGLQAYRAEKNVCSIDGLPTPLAVQQS